MEPFLRDRGIGQQVIDVMIADKIDCDIVTKMTDDELKRYICAYGDRIALMAFSRAHMKSQTTDQATDSVPGSSSHTVAMRGSRKILGNCNAAKTTRRMELGWLHQARSCNIYKQVRLKNGGGTRNMNVEKTCQIRDILPVAVETFFPNDKSKLGNSSSMVMEMRDFQGDRMDPSLTVEAIYKLNRMKMLRLYLYTQEKKRASTSDVDELPDLPPFICNENTDTQDTQPKPILTPDTELNPGSSGSEPACEPNSDDSFVEAGTPGVSFRRNRLSLYRRNSMRGSESEPCRETTRNMGESLLNAIDVCDSEDEEMSKAIEASLNDSRPLTEEVNIEQVLNDYQNRAVDKDIRSDVIVFRCKVLESAFRALSRKSFIPRGRLYVKFSGEMGQDFGGPRREFFRLAVKELVNSSLFEGPDTNRYFSHDVSNLDEGKYRNAGRLVALSIAQDGPGLHSLDPVLFDLMTGLEPDMALAKIPIDIKEMITRVKEVDSDIKRDHFLSKNMDWFIDRGINDIYRLVLNQKDHLIKMMMKHHIFYRCFAEITEFTRGLDDVGQLWKVVEAYPHMLKSIFCFTPSQLRKDTFDGICEIEFSNAGSNSRQKEEETVYCWEMVLQDMQDENVDVTLEELLVFMTGADRIPPCGFDKKIDISFYNQEDGVLRLPSVSTCGLQMWLPRGIVDPNNLLSLVQMAVKGSQGFHKI